MADRNDEDVLGEIPDKRLPFLLSIIAKELPRSIVPYECLKSYVAERKDESADNCTRWYWYAENPHSGIVVGILLSGYKTFGLLLYALDGYESLLERVLSLTEKIRWEESPIVEPILPKHYEILARILKQKRYSCESYLEETIRYRPTDATRRINVECPQDVYMAQLTADQIDHVYQRWSSNGFRTKEVIRRAVQQGATYALFSKENGQLLAWTVRNSVGAIASLFTEEKARKRGYAKFLVDVAAKRLTERGIRPFAVVRTTNRVSKSLFSSLGFANAFDGRLVFVSGQQR